MNLKCKNCGAVIEMRGIVTPPQKPKSHARVERVPSLIVMKKITPSKSSKLKPFSIGVYPVTQAQWEAVMGSNPSNFKGANRPVEQVSWNDCQEFIQKLNAKENGAKYRLPAEAEWEYACRAGSTGAYCYGDDAGQLGNYAWYASNSGNQTHPVGGKQANGWGLYDMHGNVWEWTSSLYLPGDSSRVIRGGSWDSVPVSCRSAFRYYTDSGCRYSNLGLRLARSI